jgi:hypothetical protein
MQEEDVFQQPLSLNTTTVACKRLVVFPFWRPRTFFWPHFDPTNHQKVIFCYCSPTR